MPVPAPSQLPPFLSSALLDRGEGSSNVGGPFISSGPGPISSPSATTSSASYTEHRPPGLHQNSKAIQAPTPLATPGLDWNQSEDPASTYLHSSSPLLVPPLNFDMINSGGGGGAIYRSGHPNERNFQFMSTLNLKSIVYLASDDIRDNLQEWIDTTHGTVKLFHFRLNVNKEPFAEMDQDIVANAIKTILDKRNLPTLIHCNKGKYRVGVITALIRRLQGWSITSIFDEYARFAGTDRVADEEVS
jgi:tyrosine-protein phosphatase SIW14